MNRDIDALVVLVTARSKEEAERIADHLVESRLAACVNILAPVTSVFRWEGRVCTESESLLVIKTRPALFGPLSDAVRARHSYTVPEIIALPVVDGAASYLDWITDSVI